MIGRTLDGRYRVDARLGAGGMGAVYRVEHLTLRKAFALKVLHPRFGSIAGAADRFEREAKAGGKIGHPNCVAVSDFGSFDDGACYLVMELLDGEPLGVLLDREPRLPWRRALHITRHVLRGLGHAHDHGVIHRDIKPDNIFLAHTEDDPEIAKILDFGIAKLTGEIASDTKLTQEGITIGTPAYLSPEQAFGGAIDGRSDLYSLSTVLYEMLTGRTPFGDRDALAMLTAHAVADVPPMKEVAPDADIPEAVEALVRDGLAKKVEDRIASAAEYVARIDALFGRAATPLPMRVSGVEVAQAAPTMTPFPAMSPLTPTPTTTIAPSQRRIAMYVAGAILGVGFLAAIARCAGGGGSSDKKPAPAVAKLDARAAAKAPPPDAKPTPKPPPPVPQPAAAPDAGAAAAEPPVSAEYTAAMTQLTKGKKCPDRKKAVLELQRIGDARAIPALKKAKKRMYGGLLGIGQKNANSCLVAAADAAIAELSKAP